MIARRISEYVSSIPVNGYRTERRSVAEVGASALKPSVHTAEYVRSAP
jgi:hypothetical protein